VTHKGRVLVTHKGRVLETQMEGARDTLFMVEAGPTSYRAAMASEEAELWEAAMSNEKSSLEEHKAFKFIPIEDIPTKTNVIDGKWVLQRKLKVDGTVDRHKARLVVDCR